MCAMAILACSVDETPTEKAVDDENRQSFAELCSGLQMTIETAFFKESRARLPGADF